MNKLYSSRRRHACTWQATGAGPIVLVTAALVAALCALYVIMLRWDSYPGYDYSCFRSAAVVLAHGGNPYDRAQLLAAERLIRPNFVYNAYYNPPFFATLLTPFARLSFDTGYALYSLIEGILGTLGVAFALRSLGWRRLRVPAILLALCSSPFFLTVLFGQQATLLLCVLTGAMLLLRATRPLSAGALMSLGIVKPHLMLPLALCGLFLVEERRARLRYGLGLVLATAALFALSLATSGPVTMGVWLHTLLHTGGHVEQVQNNLPTIGGTLLVTLPQPLNRVAALLVSSLALAAMFYVCRVRPRRGAAWERWAVASSIWLMVVPYLHTPDLFLDTAALVLAWQAWGTGGRKIRATTVVAALALWTYLPLPFAYVLPYPLRLVDLIPLPLVAFAAYRQLDRTVDAQDRENPGTSRRIA